MIGDAYRKAITILRRNNQKDKSQQQDQSNQNEGQKNDNQDQQQDATQKDQQNEQKQPDSSQTKSVQQGKYDQNAEQWMESIKDNPEGTLKRLIELKLKNSPNQPHKFEKDW